MSEARAEGAGVVVEPNATSAEHWLRFLREMVGAEEERRRGGWQGIKEKYEEDDPGILRASLEKYWGAASQAHAIQCSTNGAVDTETIAQIFQNFAKSTQDSDLQRFARNLGAEFSAIAQRNRLLSELFLTELLTFPQLYDPNYP